MKNKLTAILITLLVFFSCSKQNDEQLDLKDGTGTVWLSGGLYYCAEQIHLLNGDTLIVVNIDEIYKYKSGDEVFLKYRETGNRKSGCNIGIDCEIIEIVKTD